MFSGSSCTLEVAEWRLSASSIREARTLKVVSVGPTSTRTLPVGADGSVLLDGETGTRLYHGDAARQVLQSAGSHRFDTSIVVGEGGSLSAIVAGDRLELNQAGAVHVSAGAPFAVDHVEGTTLVIRSERPPAWYANHGEGNATFEAIRELTRPYPHAGYDTTGLAFENGGVVAYLADCKRNVWTGQPSEWILNSTAWPGQSQTIVVGVSRVRTSHEGAQGIQEARSAERLHCHPEREGRRQVEAYLIARGRAALAVERDGETEYVVAGEGDVVVVEPGTHHCVAAIDGPYEHFAMQVPSTFQYGYLFKDERSADMGEISRCGVEALRARP